MAEARIADIIVPEVFAPYMMERSLNQNRFSQAGVLTPNENLVAFLGGGGKTQNFPYWQDLTGSSDVPSETVNTTINPIGTDKMVARRQIREKAWGANDLSAALAGADPYTAIGERVVGFWKRAIEDAVIFSLRGAMADNIANDSSDLVVDISIEDGNAATSANKISATKTIEAVMKQGDRFGEVTTIVVHSVVYATLVQNDLIDFIPDSEGKLTIATYMGMNLVVSDNLPVIAGGSSGFKYHSYLCKSGSVAFGENPGAITPVEPFRNPAVGGGLDLLYTRRQYAIHPLGFSWVMASDTGITPTDANLYDSASWDRVYNLKNTGIVCLISNG